MKWALSDIASFTSGVASGEAVITDIVTDSRAAGPGSLFIAMRGEQMDGHDFIGEALGSGAAAVLVAQGRLPAGAQGVEVEDTLAALTALGRARRNEIDVPVIAITGSSGKTSTKDLLVAGLGSGAYGALRSYNNEVGVPLTLLGIPDGAEAVVVEIGSRGAGHIAALAPIVRPDIAVITGIGSAHLEMFGDIETVAAAKWELIDSLGPVGIAVLPLDDEHLAGHTATCEVVTFGETPLADVAVSDISLDEAGRPGFSITISGEVIEMSMATSGRHQARNAAAALAAAVAAGVEPHAAAGRIAGATLSPWRMEVHPGAVTIVNDAYNANPDSVAAALRTVAAMPGRHIAVLGKMHELGDSEHEAHAAVGALAADLGFSHVIVVGEAPGLAGGAGIVAIEVSGIPEAIASARAAICQGDVVLVKASRAEGLEAVADALIGVAP